MKPSGKQTQVLFKTSRILPNQYNYIITGAGCAGLSLLLRMMQHPFFRHKKILVVDQSPKKENDRTWCFWEKEKGVFESIVHHSWHHAHFHGAELSVALNLQPYTYKMIRGIDFYNHVMTLAASHPNIEFRYGRVGEIQNQQTGASITLNEELITADQVFNSILFAPSLKTKRKKYYFQQHFKGWVIETKKPCFDPATATLMDFRVSQQPGTAFVYIMPFSPTKALVEYTLFTENLLAPEAYDTALQAYIKDMLLADDFSVVHEEFGIIPMTNLSFPNRDGYITYIGIAGGQAKGSSGYAFQFIQKRVQSVVEALVEERSTAKENSFTASKFNFYDGVLLRVLQEGKLQGSKVFANIFSKNPTDRVFRFLDNESNLWDDLAIMRSVPMPIFLPAALKQLIP